MSEAGGTYGIDFGTTNTVIVDPDGNLIGDRTIPTLVVLDPNGGPDRGLVALGHDARDHLGDYLGQSGYHVIRSIKSFLDGDRHWRCGEHAWRPVDVVEAFLKHLRELVAGVPGALELSRAVFTLPNGTVPARRRVFRAAADAAGIEVVGFISESTAAYVAGEKALQQQEHAAVFDWGGGTLDVSVLAVDRPRVRELAVRGYDRAGDAVDGLLARWAFENRRGADSSVPYDAIGEQARQRLLNRCEEAKISLCNGLPEVELIEPLPGSGVDLVEATLTREKLIELCGPMLREAVDLLIASVREAGVSPAELTHVLLVGGTSHLLGLEQAIEERLPEVTLFQPKFPELELAVALGAVKTAQQGLRAELADHVEAVLAGDGRIPLGRPGAHAGSEPVRKLLRIVEESTHAELPVCSRRNDAGAHDGYLGSVCATTLGFHRETLTLRSRITEDMTLRVTLGPDRGNAEDEGLLELETLRFSYVFD